MEQLSAGRSTSSQPPVTSSLKSSALKKTKGGCKTNKSIKSTTALGTKGSTGSVSATEAGTAGTSSLEIDVGGRKGCGACVSRKVDTRFLQKWIKAVVS